MSIRSRRRCNTKLRAERRTAFRVRLQHTFACGGKTAGSFGNRPNNFSLLIGLIIRRAKQRPAGEFHAHTVEANSRSWAFSGPAVRGSALAGKENQNTGRDE